MSGDNTEMIARLTQVSTQMHATSDIASIMRLAVTSSMQWVNVSEGASGLLLENSFAFAECFDGQHWIPMQRNFNDMGLFNSLVEEKQPQIITSATSRESEQILALPVLNHEGVLLACLILFQPEKGVFSEQDIFLLMQTATIMASAIENSIRHADSQRIETELEKSVATYRTLVEQIPAITYISSIDRSHFIFVSPQVERMLGYTQSDFLENQSIWLQRIHEEDKERVLEEFLQSLESGKAFHSEYRVCNKGGEYIWVKDAADVVREQGEDLYLQGVLHDISERKETEQEMIRLAHFDPLTGLANRSLFLDRLKHAAAQSKRHKKQFAVLYLDLDGFKAVNDNYGHKAGDILLSEVAHRLGSHVREVDTVARMGGDEFTVILNEVENDVGIQVVAKKLIEAVAQHYDHVEAHHPITLSVGIARYPVDSADLDELITLADNAMYTAKENGKNGFVFHHSD